jgi:hypothetical protein
MPLCETCLSRTENGVKQKTCNVGLKLHVILAVETLLSHMYVNTVSGTGLTGQVGEFVLCQQAMERSARKVC